MTKEKSNTKEITVITLEEMLELFDLKPKSGFGETTIKWLDGKPTHSFVNESKKPKQAVTLVR